MKVKYIVRCYVKHNDTQKRILRQEIEFDAEPTYEQIEAVLKDVPMCVEDFKIDYASGAVLPDYAMPKIYRVKDIYAVVEKRYYREVQR